MNLRSKKTLTPEAALIRVEELCARAEHSSGEIREKLFRWGILPGDDEKIIKRLTSARFIDDGRFARAYARDKMEYQRWGKRKIALGLYQKRVERTIITEALDELDDERYKEVLKTVISAKRRSIAEPDTYEGRTKLFRHAVSRGFEPDLVAEIIRCRE